MEVVEVVVFEAVVVEEEIFIVEKVETIGIVVVVVEVII